MPNQPQQRTKVATLVLILLLSLAACSNGTSTVQVTPTSATGTPGGTAVTPPPGSNGTPITGPSAKSCADVLPGAGAASAGPKFTDLPLPTNSFSTTVKQTGGGGDGQYTIFAQDLCTQGTDTHTIFSFFANTLPAQNWPQQKWFPFDGYFYADCGDPFCWASGAIATPPRHVGLEAVTDHGNGVISFHLRLAAPPPAPTCTNPNLSSGFYYNFDDLGKSKETNIYQQIPLPPLTRLFHGRSSGHNEYELCSAPTAATILSFMSKHLLALHWTHTSSDTWTNGKYSLMLLVPDNTNWALRYLDPDFLA
ncbi:MAG: hypothetical protein H0X24_06925 [Ktedonobacterales bacterium]|nr:hypothetical protein [Ktedonobacterales bacterium]